MIDKNTIKLLRLPFSLLLMPVFLLALSQVKQPLSAWDFFIPFLIIHLLVYPASNGYNSYVDRDEQSIGGLEKPPMPTEALFYLTLALDFIALLAAWVLVNAAFALCLLTYILASRAYSARQIRLKKYPLVGFLVVVFFQGAFTYYMSHLGLTQGFLPLEPPNIWILVASSLQIAGVYPLTQIYQHEQDLADGVVTISYKLGYRGTFVFSGLMFAACNGFYWLYFSSLGRLSDFWLVQLFFIPVVSFFVYWLVLVWKNPQHANFKNTMLMNLIAAFAMNLCFIILWIKK